ncbi:hypothetical protein C1X29_28885, partial [Pseudomonas sp. GW456-12-10-14-LB2]|uniref:hypothetical protein n=1 Tax=Pseudomonas sp. GW456-12-10-14-LB2 TaxID=2070674 RepID=UPI000CAEA3EB
LEEAGITAPQAKGLPSWRRPLDYAEDIEREIRDSVRGECPRLRVLVEEGPATTVILDAIERERGDMVVIGLGRPGAFSASGVGQI